MARAIHGTEPRGRCYPNRRSHMGNADMAGYGSNGTYWHLMAPWRVTSVEDSSQLLRPQASSPNPDDQRPVVVSDNGARPGETI